MANAVYSAVLLSISSFIALPRVSDSAGTCPILELLSFGQLLMNGTDRSATIEELQTTFADFSIKYRCAQGYRLVTNTTNNTVTEAITTCRSTGEWSLVGVACSLITCGAPPPVSNAQILFTNQQTYSFGTTVSYRCNSGYRIEAPSLPATESLNEVASVCSDRGSWHLVPACVAVSGGLSDYNILVIILVIVAVVCLVSMCCAFCCSLCAFKLRREFTKGDMAEDEVAYAHSHGAFTISNPLVTSKVDDSTAGNPLYLTPDEINEFENKKKQIQSGTS